MTNKHNIGVCILAGGLARRMDGKTKPLIELAGKPLLSHILETITPQTSGPIILNVNQEPERFTQYDLPLIKDIVPDFAGPLAGIVTGLDWMSKQSPSIDDMLSLPGDAPLIPKDLIERLETAMRETDSEIVSVSSNKRTHPVIALWSTRLLEPLRKAVVDEGVRKIDRWTETRKIMYVNWEIADYDPFYNINRGEDLLGAEKVLLEES